MSTPCIRATVLAVAFVPVFSASLAQTNTPRFEVASIKPAPDDKAAAAAPRLWGDTTDRVTMHHIPLKYVLMHVYNLQARQISGPGWLDTDFFDIQAVVPAGTPKEQVPMMFESLLADRFKLKFHRESRTERVYALVVGKSGPKLKESVPYDPDAYKDGVAHRSGTGENQTISGTRQGPFGPFKLSVANGVLHSEFAAMTMENLAKFLSQGQLDLPVVNMTDLSGTYQVAVDNRGRAPGEAQATLGEAPDPDPSAGSILESLQKLGLNLVRRSAVTEKFIVDNVDKVPTDN